MNKRLLLVVLLMTYYPACLAQACEQLVVVVNKNNPVMKMDRSEVIDMFMGRYVAFSNGTKAVPVELNGKQQIKKEFYSKLVDMSLARINAYWSRLRFAGHPHSAVYQPDQQHLIEFIQNNESGIGYIHCSKLTNNLKVVFEFDE
jgi:ABC-type phosphate transport system substrate-binding protein